MVLQSAKAGKRGRTVEPRPDPARVAEARERLRREGKTIAGWAREHGEQAGLVGKVLSGTRACTFGDQHRIAVKLGIKDGELPPIAHAA